ncbi:MAG: hypothetical protein WA188_01630 [Terriglobales bacterium]
MMLFPAMDASLTLTATPLGIEVHCANCSALLDRVPNNRTAFWRSVTYAEHVCGPVTAASPHG